jgi:glycosyltransferase involved in cell wall biosynthesis
MTMVDVSVIIPTRDRPLLLDRALQSICGQKCGYAYECIVVDDGSLSFADQVRAIVTDAGGNYLTNAGGRGCGGGRARNTGIAQAKGEFIAFLDDDDVWEATKLSTQIDFMKSTNLPFTYTGMHIRSRSGRMRYSFREPALSDRYRAIMRKNFIGTTSTIMVDTATLVSVGGFDAELPALQDYDLYIRLLQQFEIGWIPEPLTIYYAEDTDDKVSASRERYLKAVEVLSKKYQNDPYYRLLRRSFMEITLLKCVRSRKFLMQTLRSLLTR